MASFVQHVVSGLASGGIYGLLGLAIVLIYRASGVVNFAQCELATLSAFVCSTLVGHGWSFWPAFAVTIVLSFAGGVGIHAALIRPLQGGALTPIVLITVGLVLVVNGLDSWIWGDTVHAFHGPFSTAPIHVAGAALSKQDLGVLAVTIVAGAVMVLMLGGTRLGLGLRAAAVSPAESRLVGVPAGGMLAAGWGLAAALGAVAGVMAASSLALEPNMLQTVLLYAFAAALVGGMVSPLGAAAGGLGLGVLLSLLGAYVHGIGDLRIAVALAIVLVALLLVRRRA